MYLTSTAGRPEVACLIKRRGVRPIGHEPLRHMGRLVVAALLLTATGVHSAVRPRRGSVLHASKKEPAGPSLQSLLAVDVLSAATSSALLSPFVTIIDKSIILTAAGSSTLGAALRTNGLRMVQSPAAFVRSPEYVWIFAVYSATYVAANTIDTVCTSALQLPAALPKFLGTTATNMYMCVSKDAAFAKMFGTKAARAVPMRSLALFSARDAATVFASFSLPPQAAAALETLGMEATAAINAAQLLCPVGIQAFTAPIHLLGLDLYNRDAHEALAEGVSRARASFRNYGPVTGARMFRILPAFGIGGIGNRMLRRRGRAALQGS